MKITPGFGTRHAFVPSVKSKVLSGIAIVQGTTPPGNKGGDMKKLLTLVALASCLAVPSFAGNAAGHSVQVAGKDSAKAVTVTAKDTAKASVKVVKVLF
jgi:hypothetical protein